EVLAAASLASLAQPRGPRVGPYSVFDGVMEGVRVRRRWVARCAGAAFLLSQNLSSADASKAVVEFRGREGAVGLSTAEQERVGEKVKKLLSRCGFHFAAENERRRREFAASWDQARTQPHVYVRFAFPFESESDSGPKVVMVEEALVGLADKRFVS